MPQTGQKNRRKALASRRSAGLIVCSAAVAATTIAVESRADSFYPFPDGSVRIAGAILAAAQDIPAGAGTVHDPSGNSNDINVVNERSDDLHRADQRLDNDPAVAGGQVNFNTSQHLASLNISGGTVQLNKTGTMRSVLFTQHLNVSAGKLDLTNNDLDVQGRRWKGWPDRAPAWCEPRSLCPVARSPMMINSRRINLFNEGPQNGPISQSGD